MRPREPIEVLVVGAGPVGMTTAACLAARGVKVRLIEQTLRPAARSYALALHPASLELYAELGLADELIERGHAVSSVGFYGEQRRRAELNLAELGGEYPFLLVIPQNELEKILARRLKARGVPVLWNHRGVDFQAGRWWVDVGLDSSLDTASAGYNALPARAGDTGGETAQAIFVVGADGHRSAVRHALGLDYRDLGGAQTFLLFEFESRRAGPQELRIALEGGLAAVVWPLGGNRFRWTFEITPNDDEATPRRKRWLAARTADERDPFLAKAELEALIAERAPWFEAGVEHVTWSDRARFERRLVPSFGRGNVWLVGDAAHLAPPISVRSMNVGLLEAGDLAARLEATLQREAPAELLETYGRERLAEWRHLHGLNGNVQAKRDATPWVRLHAARLAEVIPASGPALATLAGRLGLQLEDSETPTGRV